MPFSAARNESIPSSTKPAKAITRSFAVILGKRRGSRLVHLSYSSSAGLFLCFSNWSASVELVHIRSLWSVFLFICLSSLFFFSLDLGILFLDYFITELPKTPSKKVMRRGSGFYQKRGIYRVFAVESVEKAKIITNSHLQKIGECGIIDL